jgi:hypothetical protein
MSCLFIPNVLNGWSHPLQVGAKTFVVNVKQIPGQRRLLFQLQNITLDLGKSRRRTKENVRLFWWSLFRVASWKYYYSQTTDIIAPASLPSLYSFHWTLELISCLHLITLILQIQLTYHRRFTEMGRCRHHSCTSQSTKPSNGCAESMLTLEWKLPEIVTRSLRRDPLWVGS